MKHRITLFAVVSVVAVASLVLSLVSSMAVYGASRGTSGGLTLRQSIGVRPLGMGEAFTGLADDVNTIHFNPSGLSNLSKRAVGAMYLKSFLDTYYSSVFYGQALDLHNYIGGSITTYDGGDIEINSLNSSQQLVKTEKRKAAEDYVLAVGYARDFLAEGNLSAGLNLKILQSTLAEESRATVIAFDIGGLYRFLDEKVSVGICIQNLGPGITYTGGIASGSESDPLPSNIKFGIGYSIIPEVLLACDVSKPNDADIRGNVGLEYTLLNMLSLRAGMLSGYDLAKFSYGIGFKLRDYQFDYGMGLVDKFDSIHKVSFIVRFGDLSAKEIAKAERKHQKALAYFDTEEYARAILWFNKALEINTQHRDAQVKMTESHVKLIEQVYNRGVEYFDSGEYVRAILEFNLVLELDPAHEEAREKLTEANEKIQ